MTLRDFPRGGKKPSTVVPNNFLSGAKISKPHKSIKNKKYNKTINNGIPQIKEDTKHYVSSANCLTYTTLLEGMTVLGRVHAVNEYDIIVSLPGRISGQVQITNISETYNDLLQSIVESKGKHPSEFKLLSELYNRGDYIVCYVKSINSSEKYRVSLSLEPNLINENLNPMRLEKGAKIICSVTSIEDHGYIVNTGIKTLRGFLANNDVDNNVNYYAGQQLFCYVKSAKSVDGMTTVKLSTKSKLKLSTSDFAAQSLDSIAPGTRMMLTIKKILSNGLAVAFNEDNIGYINQLYLNKSLSFYEVDDQISGILLYVLPTVKLVYFTQKSLEKEPELINIGEIIENARVLFRDPKGIICKLKQGVRGFLPFKRTEVDYEEISAKFTQDSQHKCRVLTYDMFDRVYVCSMQRNILKNDCLLPQAANPGDITTVEIARINNNGFIFVKAGQTYGNVAPEHVSDIDESKKPLKIGDKARARVLGKNKQGNGLMFTLKKSLVESKRRILNDINEAEIGDKYQGTIVSVKRAGLLVKFFGDVKGWISGDTLDRTIGGSYNYICGQVVLVKIIEVEKEKDKLIVKIIESKKKQKNSVEDIKLRVGESVEGQIVESSVEGIYLRINISSKTVTGFIPAGHMAPCHELGTYLSAKYAPGDKLSALVFSVTPELLLTRTFGPLENLTNFSDLKMNECIACSVKEISTKGLKVILPVEDFNDYGIVPYHKVDNIEALSINQILFAKITGINKKEKKVFLTTCLHELWTDSVKNNTDMVVAVDVLTLYFSKLRELSNHEYYNNKKISAMYIGQRVSGIVDKVTEHGLVLKLDNDVMATVRQSHFNGSVKVGDDIKGSVLSINYVHELVEVTLLPYLVNSITTKQNKCADLKLDVQLRGEIVLVTNWFVLVLLKGQAKGTLAALPARRHVNDVELDLSPYAIGKKVRCYVILNQNDTQFLPICLVKSAFEAKKIICLRKNMLKRKIPDEELNNDKNNKKIKTSVDCSIEIKGEDPSSDEDGDKNSNSINAEFINPDKNKGLERNTNKRKQNNITVKSTREDESVDSKNLGIPECGFFWDTNPDLTLVEPSSSDSGDDDDDNVARSKQKTKKLNTEERHELEEQKEREIRAREEALASNQVPTSVDQFDRLVLASPNSSIVWLQYMAYHLQATEIEKARAVVRRALKTISFREEAEKLNVWQAWLNLESRFGSPDMLNDVFHQAIHVNDTTKIYLHMLTVHLEAGRRMELEKIIRTMTGKFKDNPEVWIECGAAFLKIGLKDKSRLIMQRALQSLPAHEHVNIVVNFAQLENKFGDKERAVTLFENILTSYPKRVDVWSVYVDVLVKNDNIDEARKVLEKAANQLLPPRKMKTIFKKFVTFEEQHGTPESAEHAKELAVAYVERIKNQSIND